MIPHRVRNVLEWVPVLVLIGIVVFVWLQWRDDDDAETFAPLRLLNLQIAEEQITQGGQATLLNGVCSRAEEPILVEVYLAAQSAADDPLLQGTTLPFIEREPGQGEGRGSARTIDPGCINDEPIIVTVPEDFPPGRWRLFAELVTRGNHSGDIQRLTAVSEYFDVLAGE